MKRHLIGGRLGGALLQFSRFLSLVRLSVQNPEKAAMVGNAVIADQLITHLCPSGGTFVDVGAHIGSVFSSVHHADKSIRIIAFEAEPAKASHLKTRFSYCTLHAFAVGEQSGTVKFYINPKATGYNSLVKDTSEQQTEIVVDIRPLDDALGEEAPDVIKIDIEGAELGALRSGQKMLRTHKPTIMFESVGAEVNALGYSAQLVWEFLNELGYVILTPDRVAHDAPALTLETFLDAHAYPMRTHNYFAIHLDKRITVRDEARKILRIVT